MDCGGLRTALVVIRELLFAPQNVGGNAPLVQQVDALDGHLQVIRRLQSAESRALDGFETSVAQVDYTIKTALERVRHLLQAQDGASFGRHGGTDSSQREEFDDSRRLLQQSVLIVGFLLDIIPAHSHASRHPQAQAADLDIAARVLAEAQSCSRAERDAFLARQCSVSSYSLSLRNFLQATLGAENELTAPSLRNPASDGSAPAYASSGVQSLSMPQEKNAILPTHDHKIARRPIARASTAPLLAELTPPSTPRSPVRADDRRRSRTMSLSFRLSPRRSRRTGTRELFTQATRSLNHLTYELEDAEIPVDPDLPPPYREHISTSSRPTDVKRPHASSTSSASTQHLSTFALVQDNLQDSLRERVEQGGSINELDPLTGRTALMEAAYLERAGMVSVMLMTTNQLHQKDLDGNSALHFAAFHGNAVICRALLDAGAAIDYNKDGETAISLAARGGHRDAVDCLLDFWTVQRGTAAALSKGYLESLRGGNPNTVAAFIERGIKPKKIKESVLYAAEGGSVAVLDYILTQKAPLKERNGEGWTALHCAAEKGHLAMVEKLLALGLSWKAQTKKTGETALALAIRNRHAAAATSLILIKGAQVNRSDDDRVSPLHHAVRNGDLSLMTTLLNAGAKLDVQSKYGWTVMHTAAAYGHSHLVAELITRGVSIEDKLDEVELVPAQKTNEGARKGYWAEIRWPHTNARPLHLSLEFGHDEVANLLIAAGAKIDVPDGKGWRPLHYASFSARPSMVELLLSKGASPHATTDDNSTPLGLGFRAYGLDASEDDKEHVWELLQGAMSATKKSRRKQFADFMAGSSAGRQVEKRNRIWHTAELAASLHLQETVDEGASERGSELTVGTSRRWSGANDQADEFGASRASYQESKRPPY